mmetsp:Transcript_58331/g.126092  ORF Transcript_58331/g.126092 Transcript_58331/m.126092 type:complete len:216 (-) Transcript_58331:498-1145(-)
MSTGCVNKWSMIKETSASTVDSCTSTNINSLKLNAPICPLPTAMTFTPLSLIRVRSCVGTFSSRARKLSTWYFSTSVLNMEILYLTTLSPTKRFRFTVLAYLISRTSSRPRSRLVTFALELILSRLASKEFSTRPTRRYTPSSSLQAPASSLALSVLSSLQSWINSSPWPQSMYPSVPKAEPSTPWLFSKRLWPVQIQKRSTSATKYSSESGRLT